MARKTAKFTKVEGNAIIITNRGHTLCAVFSGQFAFPAAAANAIAIKMREWQEDSSARIPFKGERKRSYDGANFVIKNFFLRIGL